jgi:hypothetical protein
MRIRVLVMTAVVWALPMAFAGAVPDGPAPVAFGGSTGPPPAWIEAAGGDQWLTTRFEQWCPAELGGVCASEPIAALAPGGLCLSQLLDGVPEVRLAPGEPVRFHLAAGVRAVSLVRRGTGAEVLTAAEVIDWTAPTNAYAGRGALAVRFDAGAASYRARFVVSEPASVNGCIEPVGRYGPDSSRLFRRFPGARPAGRVATVRLGFLPRGRYRVRLLVRDRSGNSTMVLARFGANRGIA